MNPKEKSVAEIQLKRACSLFENSVQISIKDLPKIQAAFSKTFEKITELKISRESWRIRAENAERKLKEIPFC